MARLSRENEKLQRQVKAKEESLNSKNEWGITDSVPRDAINNMIEERKRDGGAY